MKIFQFLHRQIKSPVVIGFVCSIVVHIGLFASLFGFFSKVENVEEVGTASITMSLASINTNSNQKNYSTPAKSQPHKKHKKPKEHHKIKHKPKNPIPVQEEQIQEEPQEQVQEQVKDAPPVNAQEESENNLASNQNSQGSTQESLAFNEGISDEFYRKVQEAIRKKHHYPRLAKIRELQGVVYVEFILNTDGSIEGLKVYQTNTGDILNQQALKTIREAYKNFPLPPKRVRLKIPIEYEMQFG